jgi:hypothetical protein
LDANGGRGLKAGRKVRDREYALASTLKACAPQITATSKLLRLTKLLEGRIVPQGVPEWIEPKEGSCQRHWAVKLTLKWHLHEPSKRCDRAAILAKDRLN